MKNIKRVRLKYVLPIFAAAVATLLLINSCKKNVTDPTITDTKVLQAKAWYESTYSVTSKSNNAPLATLSTSGQSAITNFSQRVSPDWQHSASYNRLNKDVVEMPIDPSSNYNFSLKNTNKAYSRTSFLILKSGNTYNAFVMLVVADSAYVNNDLSKLTHNTYRKHDADFSGTLIYFTPDGKLVSRYSYKNGKIVANSNSAQTTNTQQVQSLKTNTDGAAVISLVCIDTWEAHYYAGVLQSVDLVDENCYIDGVSSGGGSGSGSSGGGTTSPPNPCPQTTNSVSHLTVNAAHDPVSSDPGPDPFPDPTDPTTSTQCQVVIVNPIVEDIANDVKNDCLRGMVDIIINANVKGNINALIQGAFGDNNQTLNLTFSDQFTMVVAGDDGEDIPRFDANDPTKLTAVDIHLNASTLANSSQEFIAATIMHEAIHSYLDSKGIALDAQHDTMAANYVTTMATNLMAMFPSLTKDAAYSLAWGGLENTNLYQHPGTVYFPTLASDPTYASDLNTIYRAHTDGNGHFFGHGCTN